MGAMKGVDIVQTTPFNRVVSPLTNLMLVVLVKQDGVICFAESQGRSSSQAGHRP